ncbi:MAG: helix-turn-helix transcriptional regulator [Chloroflexi bacterium]|nr:helix-turn-helix transcriptional regulator [Chloroflexota bacterium]
MTLSDFLESRGFTDSAFADLAGLSQPQINRLRRGASRPSLNAIEAIAKASGGAVSPSDWFNTPQAAVE